MAVILDFNICSSKNCKSIQFTETTGTYSTSVLTGWGSPNDVHTGAEAATLAITPPDGNTYTINLFTSGYPTNTVNQTVIIPNTSIGFSSGEKLESGWYEFLYTVTRTTATAFSYTQTKRFFITCQTDCCVAAMFADIADTECTDCQDDKIDFAMQAYALLEAAKEAGRCGQEDKAENLLALVEKMCNDTNCSTCN